MYDDLNYLMSVCVVCEEPLDTLLYSYYIPARKDGLPCQVCKNCYDLFVKQNGTDGTSVLDNTVIRNYEICDC